MILLMSLYRTMSFKNLYIEKGWVEFRCNVEKALEKDKCLQEGLIRSFMKKIMVTWPKLVKMAMNRYRHICDNLELGLRRWKQTSSVLGRYCCHLLL